MVHPKVRYGDQSVKCRYHTLKDQWLAAFGKHFIAIDCLEQLALLDRRGLKHPSTPITVMPQTESLDCPSLAV